MCAVDARFIYLTGGKQDGQIQALCLRYDILTNLWQEIPDMKQARCLHSSCELAGYIFVFCGMNSYGLTNSVEKLAIDTDSNLQMSRQWQLIPQSNLVGLPKLE